MSKLCFPRCASLTRGHKRVQYLLSVRAPNHYYESVLAVGCSIIIYGAAAAVEANNLTPRRAQGDDLRTFGTVIFTRVVGAMTVSVGVLVDSWVWKYTLPAVVVQIVGCSRSHCSWVKFPHRLTTTTACLISFLGAGTCRTCQCEGSEETLQHILIACRAPRKVVRWPFSYRTSTDISEFLRRRLTVTDEGRLLYAYGKQLTAVDAFVFVTGFLSADFGVFLRCVTRTDDTCARKFLTYLSRSCSRGL